MRRAACGARRWDGRRKRKSSANANANANVRNETIPSARARFRCETFLLVFEFLTCCEWRSGSCGEIGDGYRTTLAIWTHQRVQEKRRERREVAAFVPVE